MKKRCPSSRNDGSAVLLISCRDRRGLVNAVTDFLLQHNGNIIDLEQHVDLEERVFFMRVEWELAGFDLPPDSIDAAFHPLAERMGMFYQLHFSGRRQRMAIFVSKMPHCLLDLLGRRLAGEWAVDVPLIVSNHPDLEPVALMHDIPFHCLPKQPQNKSRQEARERELLQEHGIDFVVLARYMVILSESFCEAFPNRIINIHHSFLPAFVGARPYHSAHERGVKIIGATSHYATSDLDQGPIIEQEVMRVSHRDSTASLIRKGRDLEKIVLARAVWAHLCNRILVYKNRTVVFG